MHIARLRLTHFRNHSQTEVAFRPGVNILVGQNGQGKTNVAEALQLLATGSSHRTHQLGALVQMTADTAVINADLMSGGRSLSVDVQLEREGGNKARANGSAIRMRELSRFIHVVLFAPEDLDIIRKEPEERRTFIDSVVTVLSPRMIAVHSDYDRVLKQRNSLLKSLRQVSAARRDTTTLDIWDEKLRNLGAEITFARLAAISSLRDPVREAYQRVAGITHLTGVELNSRIGHGVSEHLSRLEIVELFEEALMQTREDDVDRGTTSIGPHRDDVVFSLNTLPVKGYASHGETWSFTLALRLATAELFRHDSLGDPVLLLDDVFAELDLFRRERLIESIKSFEQVVITVAVEEDIPDLDISRMFSVKNGQVTETART